MKKEELITNLYRLRKVSVYETRSLLEMLNPKLPPVEVDKLVEKDLNVKVLTETIEIIGSATVPVYCCECTYRKELPDSTNNVKIFCGRVQCGVTNPEVDPLDYCSRGVKEVKENEG